MASRASIKGNDYLKGYQSAAQELQKLREQIANVGLPPELQEMRELYSPEGQYLSEAATRIQQAQAQGTAGATARAIATGMGSYGVTGGAAARYAREAELAFQEVESQRYDKYAQALSYISEVRMNQMNQQIALTQQLAQIYSEQAQTEAGVYTTTRGQNIQRELGYQQAAVQMYGIKQQAKTSTAALEEERRQYDISSSAEKKPAEEISSSLSAYVSAGR